MRMENTGKKYTTLLFDADDTLLDFQASEYEALGTLFERLGYPIDDLIRATYSELNAQMWREHERGGLSREKLCNTRFQILFEKLGKEVDGTRAEAIYREALGKGAQTVEGAVKTCRVLSRKYTLHIVTNGIYETQIRRLYDSGLDKFFKKIFVSDKIGHSKPSCAFFDFIFRALSGMPAKEMLLIGDSLSSDIQGGINAGIDTCWFNPQRRPTPPSLRPSYEIERLQDLVTLLADQVKGG